MGNIRPRKIQEILEILWRRKITIFLIAGAMLLATLSIINNLPDVFEARGLVAISSKNGIDQQIVSAQITGATQKLVSQTLLESIIRKYSAYSELENESIDTVVAKMRKNIKTETKFRGYYPDGPESFSITYRHPDQKIAQQVMTELVSIFDNSNAGTLQETGDEILLVNHELAKIETELNQFVNSTHQKNSNVSVPKTVIDPTAVNAQRLATASAIDTLNDKQFGLEQQITSLKKQIADQQKPDKQKLSGVTNSASRILQFKKIELEGLLTTYLTQYTEKNPKVIQTRTQLADINRQLEAASTEPEFSALALLEERELRDHQRELARLEIDNEVTKRELQRKKEFLISLPNVDPSTAFTKTENATVTSQAPDFSVPAYTNLIDRQKTLLQRRETLQRQLIGGSGIFQVVDQPTVSQIPVAPNRPLLQIIGLAMALGLGMVVALSLEAPRVVRLQDERDIEYFLGTPILAAIPETLTAAENNRSQRLGIAGVLLKLILIALLIPLSYLLLNGIKIFQILGNR